LQDTEKLAYAATSADRPSEVFESQLAERLAAVSAESGEEWLEAANEVDLDLVYNIANNILMDKLDKEYEAFVAELKARNEDRADIQLQTLNQHFHRQMEQLNRVLETHKLHGRVSLVRATEGRIRALENRVQQQRLRIESRREVRAESVEIAIALILIE